MPDGSIDLMPEAAGEPVKNASSPALSPGGEINKLVNA